MNPVTPTKDDAISGTFSPGQAQVLGFNKALALQQKACSHVQVHL